MKPIRVSKISRKKLLDHIVEVEGQLKKVVGSWRQQRQLIQMQGAALKRLLDGFRPVPGTRKARSRWLARKELAAFRKLAPPSEPIAEGTVKKGGQNEKPSTPRPAPPKGQGGSSEGLVPADQLSPPA